MIKKILAETFTLIYWVILCKRSNIIGSWEAQSRSFLCFVGDLNNMYRKVWELFGGNLNCFIRI